ncbi:diaminobutyrate acetyltransferase [Agromyces archimandritae]|uniref:L-2,4-diaminobutyric acid acetyltransferase n=1 Tax=Agromyces archimandritae TaxID=2781962 RepID=A0A975FLL0_9MICO|nr:diaminobutyrate acetyltransferase [Agromyces archimandritae]QTX04136.1 diaminobutyrate acetyltransferase [Agromyces archimandritae]
MSSTQIETTVHDVEKLNPEIVVPDLEHASEMWRIAKHTEVLDLNTSYAYLVYCRDFARTSRVALDGDDAVGFVMGHVRPERPHHLFIWQVAVDESHRGQGLAGRMLDELYADVAASNDIHSLETTITDDNEASQRLFGSFARRWQDAAMTVDPLFEPAHFPDGHGAERLYEIGPITLPEGFDAASEAREPIGTRA